MGNVQTAYENIETKPVDVQLSYSAECGDIERLTYLLETHYPSGTLNIDTAKFSLWTPLFMAAKQGHAGCVKKLLEAGAVVDGVNLENSAWTPLWVATYSGHEDCVQLLVEAGANLEAKYPETPLFIAARENREVCLKLLLDAGASVNVKDKQGQTPLHIACLETNKECIELLVSAGADLESRDANGRTPLLCACESADAACLEILLRFGANPNVVATGGQLPGYYPMHICASKSKKGSLQVLWKHGACPFVTKDMMRPIDLAVTEAVRTYLHEREEKGRKSLRFGALPTRNLPERSHQTLEVPERRQLTIVQEHTQEPSEQSCYKTFKELCDRTKKIKARGWDQVLTDSKLHLKLFKTPYALPKYELVIQEQFRFTCAVYGWMLPSNHRLYEDYDRSLARVTVSKLLSLIEDFHFCLGIQGKSDTLLLHAIPFRIDVDSGLDLPIRTKVYYRPKDCRILFSDAGNVAKCNNCVTYDRKTAKSKKTREKALNTPAKVNAPVSVTDPRRLKLTLRNQRLKCAQLQKDLENMRKAINSSGLLLDPTMCGDISYILSENRNKMTPFMKLFWEQQQTLSSKGTTGVRYHPMIIRFCLSLVSKSPSAYDELRNTNILTLPSRRTLRDYRNAIRPTTGFNPGVIEELCRSTEGLVGVQRYTVIAFDEMKIQSKLAFDKNNGQLIGFLDLGDPEINYATLEKPEDLATHALAFYIRGIASDLKFNLAYFATGSLTSYQLMPLFWKAISIMEIRCQLPVVAAVSDGAAQNRKFFKMHAFNGSGEQHITHKTVNLYAPDRFIWFFADAPHLIKTARNCLFHSGTDKTRYMWNNGSYLLWDHVSRIVKEDLEHGLKLCPKLSMHHVKLTAYSTMNVRLAAQVLSETTGKILREYYDQDTKGTSEFCLIMDKFFDVLNIRCQEEGNVKRKESLQPFTNVNDERFAWLTNTFLPYFQKWKESIAKREGNFNKTMREKMFLSAQTHEGIQITTLSVIEVTKFLLNHGMRFVLTNKFNQDVVEEYFGRQRSLGRRNDNPDIWQFGYNDNVIRLQRSVAPVTGNTRGGHIQKRKVSWSIVDQTKVKKKVK